MKKQKRQLSEFLWDLWCWVSVVGIWPRYIEPNLIKVKKLKLPTRRLPSELEGLKIVQISDLHLHPSVSNKFLDKLVKKVHRLNPDILVFTGDFLCYSQLSDPNRLRTVLNRFSARYGCFAILGNHDYSEPVSINPEGDYDVIDRNESNIGKGFKHLFKARRLTGAMTTRLKRVSFHKELINLLKETPFKLLHNETSFISIKGSGINICGLGEYMLGKCLPNQAYEKYRPSYPGVILLHNPDGIKTLDGLRGELILSGHTHGGQVYLPWMWRKFALMENPHILRGLYKVDGRWVYVNRGIGSVMQFRWFSKPEVLAVTLTKDDEHE